MREQLLRSVQSAIGLPDSVQTSNTSVAGGSINQAFRLDANGHSYFVKVNSAKRHPMMFELEEDGLLGLQVEGGPRVPQVISTGYLDDDAFLVLEWIESGMPGDDFWEVFGKQLATLHRQTHKLFGWEKDNYIGSLFQSNSRLRSWTDFYIMNRLDPQVEAAFNSGLLNKQHIRSFNGLYQRLESLIPNEPPALIHGDLWSGNYLTDEAGMPVLIDPAVYYGHREMDLGMMHLFGGFDQEIYQYYHDHFPLEQGWEERIPIHQLYPLLVHVNLFGLGYVRQVESVLNRFV